MKLPTTRDTGAARLPGLPPVNAQDPSLRSWMAAVAERLEVREGTRGNPWERAVTVRELQDMTSITTRLLGGRDGKGGSDGDILVDLGGGLTASVDIDRFIASIKDTELYRDLIKRLDDPTRFDDVVEEVRTILLRDIAAEAAARGADIQRMEVKLQNANRSLAYTVQEITAAVGQASAGVREVQWAFATSDKAQAGKILQLQARLNNFYPNGGAGTATIEEQFGVYADYALGLRGQYTLKINAGGAVAGFGLAATEKNGVPSSAFIIQADKFAIVSSSYTGGLSNTPNVLSVPFGVDASGVYINGKVRINAAGKTLESLGALTSGAIVYAYQRSLSPVTTRPGRVEWTFASATITSPLGPALGGGWSKEIPAGTLPLYVTVATVAGSGATDWIENAEWSAPVLLSTNGIDGLNTATVQLFQRTVSATAPAPVSANNLIYSFSTKSLSGTISPWQTEVPSTTGDNLWVTRATASSITMTDDLPASEWSAPALIAKNGTTGAEGVKGVRGSVTLSLTDPALFEWDDEKANGLIAARTEPPFRNVIGDTVTLTNGLPGPVPPNFIQTKYWGGIGVEWTTAGVVIDGNLLVNGSISGSKIAAGSLSAEKLNLVSTYGSLSFDTNDGGTGTVIRARATSNALWGLVIDPGSLRVAGDVFCGPVTAASIYSTGSLSASTVTSRGGFGCNGKSAQGPFSLGAAATDLATVITLTNNIRAILIANGIGSA